MVAGEVAELAAVVVLAVVICGAFAVADHLGQLPHQTTPKPFAPVPLTRHERGSRVTHHALPRRHELAAAVLLPLAVLFDLLTIHARGVSA